MGQAARLLDVPVTALSEVETSPTITGSDLQQLAELYGVSEDWISGRVERHDYKTVDDMKGSDALTPNDRDIVAEFAASLPVKRRK